MFKRREELSADQTLRGATPKETTMNQSTRPRRQERMSPFLFLICVSLFLFSSVVFAGDSKKSESGHVLGGSSLRLFLKDQNFSRWSGSKGALTTIATDIVNYDLAAQTFSYRTLEHRYIVYADGQEELYDLTNDPNEWENLAGNKVFDEIKSELRNEVKGLIVKQGN